MIKAFKAALAGIAAIFMSCAQQAPKTPELTMKWKDKSLFDIPATALDGKPYDLGTLRGKVVLVVNVASECGFTGQYEGLESLWKSRKDKGLVLLGAPSNEFGGQEPGDASTIAAFCTKNYGVTFPLLAKLETKPSATQSPIYEFLGTKTGSLPGWNFCKYLVGRDGQPIKFYASGAKPMGDELLSAVDAALAAGG